MSVIDQSPGHPECPAVPSGVLVSVSLVDSNSDGEESSGCQHTLPTPAKIKPPSPEGPTSHAASKETWDLLFGT